MYKKVIQADSIAVYINLSTEYMGAIWWGTCLPTFSDGRDIICYVPPTFFSLGFVFGEVSKTKVMFVTFCVKSFSC